jgi:hypothetical protein
VTRIKLNEITTAELVRRFVRIALDQDSAIRHGDNRKFNRLFKQMDAIKEELKSRPGDQRRALIPLYDHPNTQVRLKSAVSTLAVAPEAARRELQTIADSRDYPQAGDAGMTLSALEWGIFKPT